MIIGRRELLRVVFDFLFLEAFDNLHHRVMAGARVKERCEIPRNRILGRAAVRRNHRKAISSNLLVGLIVGLFVGAVVIALVIVNVFPSQQSTQLSFQGFSLFSGSPSVQSYSTKCQGDAIFEFNVINPSQNSIQVVNVVISGSTLSRNASTLVIVSNGCLPISQGNPVIPPNSNYQFVGYVDTPLQFGTTYNCLIELGNGQNVTQTLIAQA